MLQFITGESLTNGVTTACLGLSPPYLPAAMEPLVSFGWSHSILEPQLEDLLLRTSYLTERLNLGSCRSRPRETDWRAKSLFGKVKQIRRAGQ